MADTATEGADKPCLAPRLRASRTALDRDALIEAVAAANPRTVVVLETGGPVLTPWRDKVAGSWRPGTRARRAARRSRACCSATSTPAGGCPATFPRREARPADRRRPARTPAWASVVDYKEGVLVGYRWYDASGIRPAYPFGFGLSYTRFALRDAAHRGRAGGRARRSR